MADADRTPGAEDVSGALRALCDAELDVLVLRGRAAPPRLKLLVSKRQVPMVRARIEPLGWRYAWLRAGLVRLLPTAYYWWDGGADLTVHWGVPAAPLPGWTMRSLEGELWRTATRSADGFHEPDPAALLVWLAVQACRPGRGHEDDWEHFVACRERIDDIAVAHAIARRAGVERGLARALAAAGAGGERPGRGALFDGVRRVAWRLALAIQTHAWPGRVRRLLAGAPLLGDYTIRCRVAGVEVRAEPGVFVPTPDADHFVASAVEALAGRHDAVIVEAGTGCGAIALSLAARLPGSTIHGTELDSRGVRSARRNARRLGMGRVRFHEGSVLEPVRASLRGQVDLIIANLPFYPARDYAAIGSVPRDTIQGVEDDGLGLLRELARDSVGLLRPGGGLLVQMFDWQWDSFAGELTELGYRPQPPVRSGPFAIGRADFAGGSTMRQ